MCLRSISAFWGNVCSVSISSTFSRPQEYVM
jgi:hypothetical protein